MTKLISKAEFLQLAHDVRIPLEAITERLAVVGQSGSGKTYAAMRLAELMLDAGAQVVALDPMGVWWGLLSSADGKASGYPVHVFGGEHAHVPIVPAAGALVAEVVVSRGISAVIDISHFTNSDQVMFASAFAERFYELQVKVKRPVHLFFEEAHTFLPQNLPAEGRGGDPRKNPAVMLNRMERIVRQGRSQGIGCTMVTQQPQAVNKKALNQAGTLLAMRTMGKHERKAISEWMADKATDESQLKLDQLLSKLDTGEAWVASPHFLALFKHTKVSKKVTFDSSATPKFGVKLSAPKVLAPVDVEALRAAMTEVVAEVEKDDPKVLRKRIAELERELAKKPTAPSPTVETKVVEKPVISEPHMKRLERELLSFKQVVASIPSVDDLLEYLKPIEQGLALVNGFHAPASTPRPPPPKTPSAVPPRQFQLPPRAGELGRCERAILESLAVRRPNRLTRSQIALISGYSGESGGFANALAKLRSGSFIETGSDGLTALTQTGEAQVGHVTTPRTPADVYRHWQGQLGKCERELMRVLVDAFPYSVTRDELAERSNYSAESGGFANALAKLRTLTLAVNTNEGIRASDEIGGAR